MRFNRAEASERTPLQLSDVNRSSVTYNPLSSFELEEDDGLVVTTPGKPLSIWKRLELNKGKYVLTISGMLTSLALMLIALTIRLQYYGAAWNADADPFSVMDPHDLGFTYVDRPEISKPGEVFRNLRSSGAPLPTNSWCENFLLGSGHNNAAENKVFTIPYVLDTAGPIPGVRTHASLVLGTTTSVEQTYEPENGLTLGAAEEFEAQHRVSGDKSNVAARLAIVLEWESRHYRTRLTGSKMSSPIVRGSPYTSMEYFDATPVISAQRFAKGEVQADPTNPSAAAAFVCGVDGAFGPPTLVQNEILVTFDTSDMTWLIFVSEPTEFVCSNTDTSLEDADASETPLPPGYVPPNPEEAPVLFTLKASSRMAHGMVRVAMANNCTTGQNAEYCDNFQPNDQEDYMSLLRNHYDVYPTGKANIEFTFPVKASTEEELRLNFNWHPAYMTDLRGEVPAVTTTASGNPRVELLMYATPHHQGRLEPAVGSSNAISDAGCVPTIHGVACPVTGGFWCTVEHLHRIGFNATRPVREDMLPGLRKALKTDIHFAIPENYMHGAGDTYFSGKILAKLARILLIADETGVDNNGGDGKVSTEEFDQALDRLRKGTTIWLSSKAESRLLYDASWGGIVMCGCDFDDESQRCSNKFPDCPALTDAGSNFGAGFYNDHHFHFGYHIFAAAVVAKFDHQWGRKHFQRALMLVRDIANPSTKDPFFPAWRHKDWYLGFSWASGVVTIQGQPYPNGRNQESSSEAIAAYESVALFGQSFVDIYKQSADPAEMALLDTATRIREMGRLLLATEIRSAKTYWHVQKAGTSGVFRVYPRGYEPKVVGMIWSMLAQQQTWFGNEPWKSYGIQLMPLTPAAEQRDAPSWVQEMLPLFKESCFADPQCVEQGWSISIYACMAELGQWREANEHVHQLDPAVFESAGGNGHSLSNTLWYIGTRPEPTAEDFAMGNGYTSVRQYGDYY